MKQRMTTGGAEHTEMEPGLLGGRATPPPVPCLLDFPLVRLTSVDKIPVFSRTFSRLTNPVLSLTKSHNQ